MILCDDNLLLLVTQSRVVISRKNSALSYDISDGKTDFTATSIAPLRGIVKTFGNKIYQYVEGTVTSLLTGEEREYPVVTAVDFHKNGPDLFFVKNHVNRRILLDSLGNEVAELPGPYYFDEGFLFGVHGSEIVKTDLATGSRNSLPMTVDPSASHFLMVDGMAVFSDARNEIRVVNMGKGVPLVYHYHSNKVLKIVTDEEYLYSAGKDGRICSFSLLRDERKCLLNYKGEFVDMHVLNSRLYLLTTLNFVSYDCGTKNAIYEELLPGISLYKPLLLTDFTEEETDLFRMKRKSTVRIENIRDVQTTRDSTVDSSLSAVAILCESTLFLLVGREFVSEFPFGASSAFLSASNLITVETRKSKHLLNIYSIHRDALVLSSSAQIDRVPIDSLHYHDQQIYFRRGPTVYRASALGAGESVYTDDCPFSVMETELGPVIQNDRGLFSLVADNYLIKQKKISLFTIHDGRVFFYIENSGLYVSAGDERTILLDKKIIDIRSDKTTLNILYDEDGIRKCSTCRYCSDGNGLKEMEIRTVWSPCSRILSGAAYETVDHQLVINKA